MKILIKVNAYVYLAPIREYQYNKNNYRVKNNEIYEAIYNVGTNECDVNLD